MDHQRVGWDIKLLRERRGWTQARLSVEANVSSSMISLLERGRAERLTLAMVARVTAALGAHLSVRVYWQGEGLERLRDARHAEIVERMIRRLTADGWVSRTEVSFSEYGERGSIDILAFHPTTGALLVIEVKSVVPDLQGMLSNLDRKTRLAADIARTLGWSVRSVSRLLVLPDDRTSRRRVVLHEATFAAALPTRTAGVNRWLRSPSGVLAGVLFLPNANQDGTRRPRHVDQQA